MSPFREGDYGRGLRFAYRRQRHGQPRSRENRGILRVELTSQPASPQQTRSRGPSSNRVRIVSMATNIRSGRSWQFWIPRRQLNSMLRAEVSPPISLITSRATRFRLAVPATRGARRDASSARCDPMPSPCQFRSTAIIERYSAGILPVFGVRRGRRRRGRLLRPHERPAHSTAASKWRLRMNRTEQEALCVGAVRSREASGLDVDSRCHALFRAMRGRSC